MTIEEPVPTETLLPRLKALADPTRLAIINLLMGGVQCNCEISAALGLSLSLVSHHLRILRKAGLVSSERDPFDARWSYYQVVPAALEALQADLAALLNPARIQPRQPGCGPGSCCAPQDR